MSAAALEPVRWTRRRWIYTVLAAYALQLGLLIYFGRRPQASISSTPFRTEVHLATDPWSAQQLAALTTLRDPTLFALPNPGGFSGPAWLAFAAPPTRLSDWAEPPRWLTLDADRLGETFGKFIATNAPPPLLIADKPTPRLTGLDPVVPNVPMATQTQVRIEGDLARRSLLEPLPVRSWPHTNILGNTVVQILVDAAGDTISAALLDAGSGLSAADEFARKLASTARFQPVRLPGGEPDWNAPLIWGKLIFQWHTVPPPATNSAQP